MSTIHNAFFHDGFYKCDQCLYQTTKNYRLITHRRKTHDYVLINYSHCDYKNKTKSWMQVHMEEKHLGITHQCDVCEFRGTKTRLKTHREKEHDTKNYHCTECSYIGKIKSKYQYHRELKHPNEEYICTKCNKKLHFRSSYTRHMKHQHKTISCEQCSYSDKSIHHLDLHIKASHTAVVYKQCSKCSFKAKLGSNLRYHEKVAHEGIKFECGKCGKQTRNPTKLAEHKRVCGTKQQVALKKVHMDTSTGCESLDCCRISGSK